MSSHRSRSAPARMLWSATLTTAALLVACESKLPAPNATVRAESTPTDARTNSLVANSSSRAVDRASIFAADSIVVHADAGGNADARSTRSEVVSRAGVANIDIAHPFRMEVLTSDTFPKLRSRFGPFTKRASVKDSRRGALRGGASQPVSLLATTYASTIAANANIGRVDLRTRSDTTKRRRWIIPCADRTHVVNDSLPCAVALRPLLMIDDVVIPDQVQDTLTLDPDLISHVEVLKGPSAAALSADPRAQNGIIRMWLRKRDY